MDRANNSHLRKCRRYRARFVLATLPLLLVATVTDAAERVLSYRVNDSRLLTLIRKPVVLDSLQLDKVQRAKLDAFNTRLDGTLLSIRNQRTDAFQKTFSQLTRQTQQELKSVLKPDQFNRVSQIMFYAHGNRALRLDHFVQKLDLDQKQVAGIKGITEQTKMKLAAGAQVEEFDGTQRVSKAMKQEDEMIRELLTASQRKQLDALTGPAFDRSRLHGVRFQAPEFTGGDWLNSPAPLKRRDLLGKVVVIHFWAFG